MEEIKMFISHQLDDKREIETNFENLKNSIKSLGVDLNYYLAENAFSGKNVTKKIKKAIDEHDIFILYLTEKASKSAFVNQELGYAIAKNKDVFIIRTDKTIPLSGFVFGWECFDIENNTISLEQFIKLSHEFDNNVDITPETLQEETEELLSGNQYYTFNQNNTITINEKDNTSLIIAAILIFVLIFVLIYFSKKK